MDFENMITGSIGNVPLDKGNLFGVQQKLKALQGYNYQIYLLYLTELRYFANLWNVEGDEELKEVFPALMKVAVENGKVALQKREGKYLIYALVDYTEGMDGFIKHGKGIPITYRMSKENITKAKELKAENTLFLKVNTTAFPLLFYLWNFIFKLDHYLTSADTNTKTKTKKFKFNVNNNSSVIVEEEMKSMLDPSTPWITNITSPVGYGADNETKSVQNNVLEPIAKGAGGSEESIWEDIGNFEKFWYKRFGRRMNINMKKERNISDEFDFESANFDTIENDTKVFLERFVRQHNEMFGTNAKVVSNTAILAKDSKENKEAGNTKDKDKDGK